MNPGIVLFAISSRFKNKDSDLFIFFIGHQADKRQLLPIYHLAKKENLNAIIIKYTNIDLGEIPTKSLNSLHQFKNRKIRSFICLDHAKAFRYHFKGVILSKIINLSKNQSYCIQHGGVKDNSLAELASSASSNIICWGTIAYDYLNKSRDRVINLGNILHSQRENETPESPDNNILLATTTRAELANRDEHKKYLRGLFNAFTELDSHLNIKLHPEETNDQELYLEVLKEFPKLEEKVTIFTNENINSLIKKNKLLITRASTTLEDAILNNKPVLIYDLTENGPSDQYRSLFSHPLISTYFGNNLSTKAILDATSTEPCKNNHDLLCKNFGKDVESNYRSFLTNLN